MQDLSGAVEASLTLVRCSRCLLISGDEVSKLWTPTPDWQAEVNRLPALLKAAKEAIPSGAVPVFDRTESWWNLAGNSAFELAIKIGEHAVATLTMAAGYLGNADELLRVSYGDESRERLQAFLSQLSCPTVAEWEWLESSLRRSSGMMATDDSAFVDAKTLREQRGMTAGQCNKFLKKNGTESAQPVEGKIRYRKPNKKTLDIHSGDWLKFWKDFDTRQSEALDDDSMQDFLANAEAEEGKIKAARKRRK